MKRLEWYIARRYLASRRKGRFLSLITLISVSGICLGVTALITVIAVMTGLQRDLRDKILGSNPHVYVFEHGEGFRLSDWPAVLERVAASADVVAAEPFVMTEVGITRDAEYAQFGTLYGIDPDISPVPLTEIQRRIREGELALGPTQSGLPGLLIGRRLAEKLNLFPGDTVLITAGENVRRGPMGEFIPSLMQFEVTGRFTTGMFEYDNKHMYTTLEAAQELLDLGERVSGIAVDVTDAWAANETAARLQSELGYPYWTHDWMTLNHSLFSALKLEKIAMAIILFLIVLVAAFNIISTLIMVVTDKTREIGILKSMGMTSRRILRIFMLQGLTIGVIGTLFGVVGGLVLISILDRYEIVTLPGDIYFVETLPVALQVQDLLMIVLASVAIAFAATIYPALQASRLMPVEAIRHD